MRPWFRLPQGQVLQVVLDPLHHSLLIDSVSPELLLHAHVSVSSHWCGEPYWSCDQMLWLVLHVQLQFYHSFSKCSANFVNSNTMYIDRLSYSYNKRNGCYIFSSQWGCYLFDKFTISILIIWSLMDDTSTTVFQSKWYYITIRLLVTKIKQEKRYHKKKGIRSELCFGLYIVRSIHKYLNNSILNIFSI